MREIYQNLRFGATGTSDLSEIGLGGERPTPGEIGDLGDLGQPRRPLGYKVSFKEYNYPGTDGGRVHKSFNIILLRTNEERKFAATHFKNGEEKDGVQRWGNNITIDSEARGAFKRVEQMLIDAGFNRDRG